MVYMPCVFYLSQALLFSRPSPFPLFTSACLCVCVVSLTLTFPNLVLVFSMPHALLFTGMHWKRQQAGRHGTRVVTKSLLLIGKHKTEGGNWETGNSTGL